MHNSNRLLPLNIEKHWQDPKGLIQVLIGPRQVGKTTYVTRQLQSRPHTYASADTPTPPNIEFIIEHWHKARQLPGVEKFLVLDEIQKIPRWSEVVKSL